MESSRPRKASSRHSCIVADPFVREQIDPRIADLFAERGVKVKFGDLRRTWRNRHCATLNPYSSEDCPYTNAECALAYFVCVRNSTASSRSNPMGYFWAAAKTMALDRADNKPLARELSNAAETAARSRHAGDSPGRAVQGHEGARSPGRPGSSPTPPGPNEGGLRSRVSRPTQIGALLGALDFGPREGPADDGEAGTE